LLDFADVAETNLQTNYVSIGFDYGERSDITYIVLRRDFACLTILIDVFTRAVAAGIWPAAWTKH
jgi:hypothetical protein